MTSAEFQLRGVDDPRLAVHATSSLPAWLWSPDGTRVLWANPVGARLLGAANAGELAARPFGPADPHRRQMAQLARRLPPGPAPRLERLRGFGAPLGALVTCACSRLEFSDGSTGILVAAAQPIGRPMPLIERLRTLVEGIDMPIAAFARDGLFIEASAAARALLGFSNLAQAGLDQARTDALKLGHSETPIGIGQIVLRRVGAGTDVGLVALLALGHPAMPAPDPTPAPAEPAAPRQATAPEADVALKAPDEPKLNAETLLTASGEAPAEFALLGETAAAGPDRPAGSTDATPREANPEPGAVAELPQPAAAQSELDSPDPLEAPPPRPPHPLRFLWQMDADGHFAIGSDEFTRLIGPQTAARFGRRWDEIARVFGLDPDGRMAQAIAGRKPWSGLVLNWPVDQPGAKLTVELSGLPMEDRDGRFAGYRGFGLCRDLDALARLAVQRHQEAVNPPQPLLAGTASNDEIAAAQPDAIDPAAIESEPEPPSDNAEPPPAPPENSTTPEDLVETPKNVLPFRPVNDIRSLSLTPVENSAFNELARQLSARLESETATLVPEPPALPVPEAAEPPIDLAEPVEPPDWLSTPAEPPRGDSRRDRTLLDLMPVGALIYRLDRLLYANRAFLERMGYASLQGLEQAGGLDVLFLEAGVSSASSTSETGTPVSIAAPQAQPDAAPAAGHLFTIDWDGEPAMALIFAGTPQPAVEPVAELPAEPITTPSPVGAANAEELAAIIDTTAEGVVMFDAEGNISCCNRSAEALFGYSGEELVQRNLTDLVAPESQRVVRDYLDSLKGGGAASLDHGRETLGRVREGGLFPLAMTIGRTRPDGPNFFAVLRDLTQAKKTESDLAQARRQAERAAGAKADVLAKLSHEIRTPLNALLGFAEVMIEQRFGALGNERYVEYMKDIRASGERVIAIVNDLLDLSRIETGKLDLAFENQDLNVLVEQSVALLQPQANRERIIIRTSLAHLLPPVLADAQALRQITLNLIGTSIHLANAGGQVIVSTALSDFGEVILRVRDTGHRLNESELAAAMEPFGQVAPSDHAATAGVSLSLTKALVEANRAKFHIKTAPHSGTLIEVVFSQIAAKA